MPGDHWPDLQEDWCGIYIPIAICMVVMLIDSVLYMLLAIYLHAVFPGKFGQREMPFYCFKYCCKKSNCKTKSSTPKTSTASVFVQDLKKQYGTNIVYHDLNLSFYESQITSLLGNNAAGKTTLLYVFTIIKLGYYIEKFSH